MFDASSFSMMFVLEVFRRRTVSSLEISFVEDCVRTVVEEVSVCDL